MIAFVRVSGICTIPPASIPVNTSERSGTPSVGRAGAKASDNVSRGMSATAATIVRAIPSIR
jgi:hypothetical protein